MTAEGRTKATRLHRFDRWLYAGGRPNRTGRLMNRLAVVQFAAGIGRRNWVTLEVPGRVTGRIIAVPVVMADHDGARHLVSMLGGEANWVRNVRAAEGRAVLRLNLRLRVAVQLVEVEPAERAPIIKRYLALAPGARAHIPVEPDAPLEEFEKIAADVPVFRITRPASAAKA